MGKIVDYKTYMGTIKNNIKILSFVDDNKTSRKDECNCQCLKCNKVFIGVLEKILIGSIKQCKECRYKQMGSSHANNNVIESGTRFGNLIVIKPGPMRQTGKENKSYSTSICKCELCGKETIISNNSLKRNLSTKCNECKKDKMREAAKEKIKQIESGTRFGKLIVICPGERKIRSGNLTRATSICKCDCGNTCTILNDNLLRYDGRHTISCGCVVSKMEEAARIYLSNKNIEFSTQYSFPNLRSNKGHLLLFDIALLDNGTLKCLIELQGEQHYYTRDVAFGKQQREETDILKRCYCSKNNIKLYEIRYDDDLELKLNYILNVII